MKRRRNRKSRARRIAELELAAELAEQELAALQALENTMQTLDTGAELDFPEPEEGGEG